MTGLGILLLGIALGFVICDSPPAAAFDVFATGLNNPRGLKFGPDGNLYVAEGGLGGTSTNTIGQCDQVVPPVGPYTTDGPSARIVKIDSGANVTVVADELPSSQSAPGAGSFVSGVADVAFIGNTLYAILAGAGCSHAVAGIDNSVLRVNSDGSTTQIADLSQFQKAHPVAFPHPADFEPDGTWYSMVAVQNMLYAVEPNHGEVDRISPAWFREANRRRICHSRDISLPLRLRMTADSRWAISVYSQVRRATPYCSNSRRAESFS